MAAATFSPIPSEVHEFERLLCPPPGDTRGLAGFFNAGEIWMSRVPARLDVMGGIADYSGANVCEGILGEGVVVALQPRTDRTLRIRSLQSGVRGLPMETRISLDDFTDDQGFREYETIRDLFRTNPLASWAAYIGGSMFALLKEEGIIMPFGCSMLVLSAVPMGVGIGSSATVEIATLSCLNAYLELGLSAERIARLGQLAENEVVGAPCGIMDQTAITSGREGKLTHILCRPGKVMGDVAIPAGTGFVGISSMVRHSVAGNPYADTRIGAFMGKKMIDDIRISSGKRALDFLTELSSEELHAEYLSELPVSIRGADFMATHMTHGDPVTTIQPGATYRVAGPTRHPIEENERVLHFIEALGNATEEDEASLIAAGELMYQAHESYRNNCHLSLDEVDFLVEAVRERGAARGLYGAKITGGGAGGTVAIFGKLTALEEEIPRIAAEYSQRIGVTPDVFTGTSPGAMEFGARRYRFSSRGWRGESA